MINYVVNFDEIEEALQNLLSNIGLRHGVNSTELYSKEQEFEIPPMKGRFSFNLELDNNTELIELYFQVDGFDPGDSIELVVDGFSKGLLKLCYSNRVLKFLPNKSQVELIYHNDGGYKNLIVHTMNKQVI